MDVDLLGMELPKTDEEYQRRIQLARREGYFAGAHHGGLSHPRSTLDAIEDLTRRLYPIRKRVPRSASLSYSHRATVEDGRLILTLRPDLPAAFTSSDVQKMADLILRPCEEVTE